MSSVLTKTVLSSVVSYFYSGDNKGYDQISLGDIKTSLSSPAFLATYGAMVVYDIYDFFKGDIKTITTKDEAGKFIKQECRVNEIDYVKSITNLLTLLVVCEKGGCDSSLFYASLGGAIVLETVKDAFNLPTEITIADEINADNCMIIE